MIIKYYQKLEFYSAKYAHKLFQKKKFTLFPNNWSILVYIIFPNNEMQIKFLNIPEYLKKFKGFDL